MRRGEGEEQKEETDFREDWDENGAEVGKRGVGDGLFVGSGSAGAGGVAGEEFTMRVQGESDWD